MKKLGIIQSRGLGDIVISLPIAHYYHRQGWEVHWPICREFLPHFELTAPWVHWHTVTTDHGSFFYDQPLKILTDLGCDEILPLYQALTGHPEFSTTAYFQHTKFDQYKYIRAGVPFSEKWRLSDCITRQPEREQAVLDRIQSNLKKTTNKFILIHLQGSDHVAEFDTDILPQTDDIEFVMINDLTDSVFDWLGAIEQSWAVILVDSVFSNIVDQMNLLRDDSRYFIPRSHIGLTPVLAQTWTWLENRALQPQARAIRA